MLFNTLEFLREQLNFYLNTFPAEDLGGDKIAKLENIASLDDAAIKNTDNILISLVNIAEETTLKNIPHYVKDFNNTVYRNPPVYLNLFVLFTAVFKKYEHGLIQLSRVVRFFQGKYAFDHKNSFTKISGLNDFSIIMDLYSPTFEQANYLWSTLGGKQHPFALYKLRLAEMQRESRTEERGIIKEVQLNEDSLLKNPT